MENLSNQLARTEAIKAEMATLLRQLEEHAAGHAVAKPGRWRHHPQTWLENNPPPSAPVPPLTSI